MPAGRWHVGLFCIRTTSVNRGRRRSQRRTILISLRGLAVWSLLLSLAAYLGGAAALHAWYDRSPHNRITYADLTLPHRWHDLVRLRGATLIAESRADFAEGNFQNGFAKLRGGLARHPHDPEARLLLAQLYTRLRLRPQARETLLAGLDGPYPGDTHLRGALSLLATADDPDTVLDYVRRAEALAAKQNPPPPAADLRLLNHHALLALRELDRLPEAAERAARHDPVLAEQLRAQHLIDTGQPAEAVALMDALTSRHPRSAPAWIGAARIHRQAGDHARLDHALAQTRAINPASPAFAALVVTENRLARRDDHARAALEDYLFRHGGNPQDLRLLSAALADDGHPADLLRLEAFARELGYDRTPHQIARIKALLRQRDWPAMRAAAARLLAEQPPSDTRTARWAAIMELLASICAGDASGLQTRLTGIAFETPAALDFYRTLLDALVAAGRDPAADDILGLAEGLYPDSRYLASVRARIEDRRAARAAALAAEPAEPPPAVVSLADVRAAVETLVRDDRPAEALLTLRRTRRHHPDLLPAGHPWAAEQEILLAHAARDLGQLRFHLRDHLRVRAIAPDRVLDLARQWKHNAHDSAAMLALREILRAHPDHAAALHTLDAWTPKPEPEETADDPASDKTSPNRRPADTGTP